MAEEKNLIQSFTATGAANADGEDSRPEQTEAQLLNVLSALVLTSNWGFSLKTWAAKLLVRCVCQRLGSTPVRFLQATNHADLKRSLPPIESFTLKLPEQRDEISPLQSDLLVTKSQKQTEEEKDDFITAASSTAADEMIIVLGTDQGNVRFLNITEASYTEAAFLINQSLLSHICYSAMKDQCLSNIFSILLLV